MNTHPFASTGVVAGAVVGVADVEDAVSEAVVEVLSELDVALEMEVELAAVAWLVAGSTDVEAAEPEDITELKNGLFRPASPPASLYHIREYAFQQKRTSTVG